MYDLMSSFVYRFVKEIGGREATAAVPEGVQFKSDWNVYPRFVFGGKKKQRHGLVILLAWS